MLFSFTKKNLLLLFLVALCAPVLSIYAQETKTVSIGSLLPKVEITFSPASGTFTEKSSFDVPVYINTHNNSINTIDLTINFDASKMAVIQPVGTKSVIGIWVEPPTYDNTNGVVHLSGVIPNGIKATSGLIGTLTFKVLGSGEGKISISDNTSILLNDGQGSRVQFDANRGDYTFVPKAPNGVTVYSETHSIQSNWYNNPNPSFAWEKESGVTNFSYVLDDKPFTVPDNGMMATSTGIAFQNIGDGTHYFHIKALKQGVWGGATHFQVNIDTAPPAVFVPKVDYLMAAVLSRALVTFQTTDALSGVDHYEVGVINNEDAVTKSPAFVQTGSPYQVPFSSMKNAKVFVRAFDTAGNVREVSIAVSEPWLLEKIFDDYKVTILVVLLLMTFLVLLLHYFVGHHIVRHIRNIIAYMKNVELKDEEKKSEGGEKKDGPPVI